MAKDVAVFILTTITVFAIVALLSPPADHASNSVLRESSKPEDSKPHSSIGVGTEGYRAEMKFQVEHQTWDSLPATIQAKRDIPRMDFNFKKVPNTFCGGSNYTSKQQCSGKYKESLVMTALPLMIVAFLTVIIFMAVLFGRNCLSCFGNGCCGGKIPSQGLCFGGHLARDDGYTPYRRKIYVFLCFAIVVLVAVAMAVGFTGNTQLSAGIKDLMSLTQTIPAKVRRQLVYIDAEINSLKSLAGKVNPGADASLWTSATNALFKVDKSVKTLQKDANSAYDKVKKYENQRKNFFFWAFISAPIIAVFGLVGYFVPMCISIVALPLFMIAVVLCWIVIGVHIPVAVATADFCVDLDHSLKHPNASMGAIDMLLKCGGKSATASIIKTSDTFIDKSYTTACNTLTTQLCNTPNVSYPDAHGKTKTLLPVTCPKMKCDKTTLKDFINKTIVADFQYGCAKLVNGSIATVDCQFVDKDTAKKSCLAKYGNSDVLPCTPTGQTFRSTKLKTCAKSCFLNATKTLSSTAYGNFELLQRFTALKKKHLDPLLSCQIIRAGVTSLEHTLCWEVVNATDYIVAGLSIIGITCFLGVGVYLGAQKVFNRKYWQEYYPRHYDELFEGAGGTEGTEHSLPLLGGDSKSTA